MREKVQQSRIELFLAATPDVSFSLAEIAEGLLTTSAHLRTTIDRMVNLNLLDTHPDGRRKLYQHPTKAPVSLTMKNTRIYCQSGPAWDTVRSRLEEFRSIPSMI